MNDEHPSPPRFQQLDRVASFPYERWEYRRRLLWQSIQPLVMTPPWPRAQRWRTWWLRQFGAKIDTPSGVQRGARVMHPWLLAMGVYSMIGPRVSVYNLGQVTIGEHTVLSQDVYLCAGSHDYTDPAMPLLRPPITIGSGVWIAAGAFIGPGVTLSDNAVIGARAVVMRDVPPGKVVAGNPARVVKDRFARSTLRERSASDSEPGEGEPPDTGGEN